MATLACFSSSLALADQVVLKNGDRVTGAIVKKDAKTLTIKSDHFGVLTTAWDQVASITADKPVNVVLQDGRTLVSAWRLPISPHFAIPRNRVLTSAFSDPVGWICGAAAGHSALPARQVTREH